MNKTIAEAIERNSLNLSCKSDNCNIDSNCRLPSVGILSEIVDLSTEVIFPGYFGNSVTLGHTLKNHIAINLEKIHTLLCDQIEKALTFEKIEHTDKQFSADISLKFIDSISTIKKALITDVEAMYDADPAAHSYGEVIFCYPSIVAMTHHRIAHQLVTLGVPLIPRIIAEIAHSKTGIDIHPAATIGNHFCIDHGTGVVIGETCIIGKHVRLYQGVTLGSRSFKLDENGNPISQPRHPIIEDHVTIYSNSSILGRITIGHHSTIGGNTWITDNIAPNSKITQSSPQRQK